MALSPRDIPSLQNAVISVCKEISSTETLACPWREWSEDELWRELAGCILGSRVPYEQAVAAVSYLHSAGLLYFRAGQCGLRRYERNLRKALSQPIFPSNTQLAIQKYRFPIIRANHLRRTAEIIYVRGNTLRNILSSSCNAIDARVRIISTAIGAGPKQASLFLRNIGYGDDLAVLDRHVLRYMTWIPLVSTNANKDVHTLSGYVRTERLFRNHASQMGVSVANLDLAVWVVVRVIQSELSREPGNSSIGWN
jgi:N-glycosylase/DNA lyase